jgi:hypothetical protein
MKAIATKQPTNESVKQNKSGEKGRSRSVSPLSTGMPLLQRKCACGGGCPRCKDELGIQTKLKIGEPGDKYEQEADRIADEVMRMPEPSVQRQMETQEEEEEEEMVQRKAIASPLSPVSQGEDESEIPSIVHDVLRSPGQPLDSETRGFMESRFGQNFGEVLVHSDVQAADSARTLNALAYTVGRHIVFDGGRYAPQTSTGKRLMAHELTHTLQQARVTPVLQRRPKNGTPVAKAEKDSLCSTFDFNVTRGLISAQLANYQAAKDTEQQLALIRILKLIRRCATSDQQTQIQDDLRTALIPTDANAIWKEAGTPFGGYTGMYPGYAPDIKGDLKQLGASETLSFAPFKLTASGSTHRRSAERVAAAEIPDLIRTDIVYFRGHQFARYRAPGVFSNYHETYGFDLRYIKQVGGFPNVKLMISTSCPTLCKEAFEVFHGLFPNAVILGYRQSAPTKGYPVRNALKAKVKALSRPLLLEESVDMNAIISAWKSTIEEQHAGDTARLPGFYYGGLIHYWDGRTWQTIDPMDTDNKCQKRKDFSSQYPAP